MVLLRNVLSAFVVRTIGATNDDVLFDVIAVPFGSRRDLLLGACREDAAQQSEEKDEARNKLDCDDRRQKSEEGDSKKTRSG